MDFDTMLEVGEVYRTLKVFMFSTAPMASIESSNFRTSALFPNF